MQLLTMAIMHTNLKPVIVFPAVGCTKKATAPARMIHKKDRASYLKGASRVFNHAAEGPFAFSLNWW